MSTSTIHDELTALGFSDHEARIFVALSTRSSAATAYEVAKQAQVPVANSYNVIRSLERRGAARKVLDNPAKYIAVDSSDFLTRLADETSRRCSALIGKLQTMSPLREERYVDVLKGQDDVEDRIEQMFSTATRLIVLKARAPLKKNLKTALDNAVKRGVTCYVIYYGGEMKLPEGDVHIWPHEGNGVDMGKDFCMVTADSERSIAFDAQTYDAAYSENDVFVYMTDVLLRHEIYLAEIMLKFGDEIEGHFGPALHRIREAYALTPISGDTRRYIKDRNRQLMPAG